MPYCFLAIFSVVIFFNPLTTVIESIFLFIEETIDVSEIGIDILKIDIIILFILCSLSSSERFIS